MQGYPGNTGVKGDRGHYGYPGNPGHKGEVGPTGPVSDPGAPGSRGVKGDMGAIGPIGEPGVKGERGEIGQNGYPGFKGSAGGPGIKGERGYKGQKGMKGMIGEPGSLAPPTDPPTTTTPPTVTPTAPPTATAPPILPPTVTPTTPPSVTPSATPSATCGGAGWRRVAFLNMTNPSHNCPNGLQLTGYKRSCGRVHTVDRSCSSSILFSVGGEQYSQVCGRAKAYQWGQLNSFFGYNFAGQNTINDQYVVGLSFTHGEPRSHIWTFAAGSYQGVSGDTTSISLRHRCPCNHGNTYGSPPFVGNDYFCESGVSSISAQGRKFFPDPLWDGRGCIPGNPCCQHNNPPWFYKTVEPTTDNIEMRMCLTNPAIGADIALEQLEIYVH